MLMFSKHNHHCFLMYHVMFLNISTKQKENINDINDHIQFGAA